MERYELEDFVSMDEFVVKTPGQWLTGYGHEADHSWFHGSTFFCDVAYGMVLVENKISHDTEETTMAKIKFEK